MYKERELKGDAARNTSFALDCMAKIQIQKAGTEGTCKYISFDDAWAISKKQVQCSQFPFRCCLASAFVHLVHGLMISRLPTITGLN